MGKGELLITSNFSFSHRFFARLLLRTHKNQGLFGKGFLVVLEFNATSTAKVIPWQSVTHTCFLAFSHQYLICCIGVNTTLTAKVICGAYVFPGFITQVLTQLFFPKPLTTFLTYFSRGERRKYTGKKSCLHQGSNSQHQVMSPTRSPLSHPGGAAPVLTQLIFPKLPTTFLTCFCSGDRRKYARKKGRLNWDVWERVNAVFYKVLTIWGMMPFSTYIIKLLQWPMHLSMLSWSFF